MTGANINKCQYWQASKITQNYCHYWIHRLQFVHSTKISSKIEAFAVLCPKLWPERWQVPTLTGVKNHRKLLPSMNSAPSNCSLCKISWKMVSLTPRSPFPFLKIAKYESRKIYQLFSKQRFLGVHVTIAQREASGGLDKNWLLNKV